MADYNENFDAENPQAGANAGAGRYSGRRSDAYGQGYGQGEGTRGANPQGAYGRGAYGQGGQGYPQNQGANPQGAYGRAAYGQGGPGGQGYPQGARQGYPQNQGGYGQGGYNQNPAAAYRGQRQLPSGNEGTGQAGAGAGYGAGAYGANAAGPNGAYGRAAYGQGGPGGQGYPQGGYPQGARPGYPQNQGYNQGYGQGYPQGGYPQNYNQGYPQGAYGQGYNRGYGQNANARNRNAQGNPNVQLVDGNGKKRYGRTSNAGAYSKEYGTTKGKVAKVVVLSIIGLVIAAIIFFVVKGIMLARDVYDKDKMTKEEQEQINAVLAEGKATEPFYMLLMGTDSADWRLQYNYEGGLTDTMIVARVDAPNGKVTLISLLRDTWIDTEQWTPEMWDLVKPESLYWVHGEIKINSVFKYGGPGLACAVVTQLTGLPISHYAVIDMDAFTSLVDTVGGIDVDIPVALYDPQLQVGFDAGWQHLDGTQALDLCRMRYAYEEMERQQGHAGDVYRAANQRMVISALLKKILTSDVGTLMSSVTKLASYVTIDQNLSVGDIAKLATAFRNIDTATDIYSTRFNADPVQWAAMVARMEKGMSPVTEDVIDESTGTILQSAGTGNLEDLTGIDDVVNAEQGEAAQAAADAGAQAA